jgi:uncharacterized membrane protein YdcZ (DUF606 family)
MLASAALDTLGLLGVHRVGLDPAAVAGALVVVAGSWPRSWSTSSGCCDCPGDP